MSKVLIADKLSPAADDILRARGLKVVRKIGLAKPELIEALKGCDGLAVRSATKIDAEVIGAVKGLKVIGRAGIGVDNIDVRAATAQGVVVMNTPYGNSTTTAEHTMAMLFAAARQIPAADVSTQAGKWEKTRFLGVELSGKTLGIIGCGNIGSVVADRAQGMKMKVIAFDPFLSEERALEIGVEKVDLEGLLARADAISLHTPLTDKTRNILSAEALKRTKPGVIVVNCARGGLVDEAALRALLDEGRVAAAAFDVFTTEPATDNPLFGATNFVATPHLGAATKEAQENVALQIAEQIADFLVSGAISNALNFPSVTAEEAPRLAPYVTLADRLGSMAGQLVSTSLKSIEVAFEGAPAELNTKPLVAAALAGVLRPALSEVNQVSAPALAAARGVQVSEVKRGSAGAFEGVMRVCVETERRSRSVAGSLFAGEPRIVAIDGVPMDAPFAPHMLYVENADKPGFIGALGITLGDSNVNIATFNLGRKSAGGDAVCLVAIDDAADPPLLGRVRKLPHVRGAQALSF
jgi:D-3-phosphoglycerate dehydrogenase